MSGNPEEPQFDYPIELAPEESLTPEQLESVLNAPLTQEYIQHALNLGIEVPPDLLEEFGLFNARAAIAEGIKAIFHKGDIIEVRGWDKTGNRYVGRYKYGKALVDALELLDSECDCYYVLNPTKLEPCTMQRYMRGTQEADVAHRHRFLLDFDPVRKEKIANTEQRAAAEAQARAAYQWLKQEQGWDGIVAACSGNGYHLLPAIDLPNDEASKQLVGKVQRAISQRFSTREVEVECFPDAARLVRAYGTLNKKGSETETLKYHRSGVLSWE